MGLFRRNTNFYKYKDNLLQITYSGRKLVMFPLSIVILQQVDFMSRVRIHFAYEAFQILLYFFIQIKSNKLRL